MDRVIVVTGGGSGMGLAMARDFAVAGERVVILGRHDDRLRRAAEQLGANADWVRADVGIRAEVEAAVAEIVRRHGRLDVLVNNAGSGARITTRTPADEAERSWDATLAVNLKGPFLMAMAVAAYLPRPGGRIINISSIGAQTGGSAPGGIAYASAKAGVIGLTLALARELSPDGITVNAVAPGYIADTGFFGAGGLATEAERAILAATPVGRAGTPDDIAAAVRYLASPEAGFVTGQVLSVNGGWRFAA